MERYIKVFVKLMKWLIMNLLISPLLQWHFEVLVVEFLMRVFGYRAPEDGQVPEDYVKNANGRSACALGGSAV